MPTEVGITNAAKGLTIRNTGLGVLHGTANAVTGHFEVTSGSGASTLENKKTRTVMIEFMPIANVPATGSTLPITTSDDPTHVRVLVNLTGAASTPQVK
jgi:hypothetical protein